MDNLLNEESVVAYLKEHPEFFQTHDELLEKLSIPHACGGVVSLIERQVEVLQERNRSARHKMHELIEIARDNAALSEKIQQVSLELISARRDLTHLVLTFHEVLHWHFEIELSNLLIFKAPGLPTDLSLNGLQLLDRESPWVIDLDRIFESLEPICGQFQPDQIAEMFHLEVGRLGSVALVPLFTEQRRLGLLALGSIDSEHFHPAMGTHFLRYLGAVLTLLLDPLIKS